MAYNGGIARKDVATLPIKLIACDMDDTLLRSDEALSPRAVAALQAAMAHGAKVALASGRMIESMLPTAKAIGVNAPMIAFNGGAVYDLSQDKILRQTAVAAQDARDLCALAESLGIHAQAYQDGGYFFQRDNEHSERYAASIRLRGQPTHRPLSQWIEKDQLKILLIDDAERIAEVLPLFQRAFAGRVHCIKSKPHYIECIAPGVDKGVALTQLAADLSIDMADVLAFGDGQNDLEMLASAGLGYAMENAPEAVKAAVGRVAPPNDDDGVAQVIEQLISEGRF